MSGRAAPRVSVVLPFRDAAETLCEALESIAGQSMADFECVLVDHRSQDRSSAIARDFAEHDRRFRIVECSGSFVDALNLGVRDARAPIVARMDADDVALPQRLELQLRAIDCGNVDLVSCLVEFFPRAAIAGGMRRYESWINSIVLEDDIRAALFVESPIPHPTAVFRVSAFERIGGYADTDGPEDYDLWLRLLLTGARVCKVPQSLLRWRESPERLSRADRRYGKDRFLATKVRHFPRAVPIDRPLQLWGAGPTGRRWLRRLRERGYRVNRIVDSLDRQVGRTVQGMTVQSPSTLRREDGMVVAAVGLLGAREIIETDLLQRGFRPLHDFITVA